MNPLTLPEAWSLFRYFLRAMAALTDEPAKLAARLFLYAQERAEILRWLAPLERFARLILLAEAATLEVPPVAQRKSAPRREFKGSRKRPVPENSEQWRVAWRVIANVKRRGKRGRRAALCRLKPRIYDSVPLAARLEALVRVALNPTPYAKRLARRLSKSPLTRKQTRPLFRAPNLETPLGRAFEHSLQSFLDLATPARLRFESG